MESVQDEPPMYVCDPEHHKDKVKSYTSYTLKGTMVTDPISRRYRDFDALRKKLVERWPGIFIPNIPHKKIMGNKGKSIIVLRLEMINRFLKKLCNLPFLKDSDEIELFLQNTSNVGKTLDGIKQETYEELFNKYSKAFSDYDENFEPDSIKEDLKNFLKQLHENHPRLRTFRQIVLSSRERYKGERENYLTVMNMLSLYEKETVNSYVNNDENKLIFFNMKNIDLCKNISNIQEKVINPYDRLYDAITEDYLETEAMIEALETLKELQEDYEKLNKSYTSTGKNLKNSEEGKNNLNNLKRILSFQSKDKVVDKLNNKKEILEKDLGCLGEVIKIAAYKMQEQMKNFRTTSMENYYKELSRLEKDTENNAGIFDDLWDTVVKDPNISEFN